MNAFTHCNKTSSQKTGMREKNFCKAYSVYENVTDTKKDNYFFATDYTYKGTFDSFVLCILKKYFCLNLWQKKSYLGTSA